MPLKRKAASEAENKVLEKKKKQDQEEAPSSVSVEKPFLVVLPGAGGKLGKTLISLLEDSAIGSKFEIRLPAAQGFSWVTSSAGSDRNFAAVNKLCAGVGERNLYVLGNSFGNRVLAEMLAANGFSKPCTRIMMCGFPLYGEANKPDRVNQLNRIPAGVNVMFVSGENDEFLSRTFMDSKGRKALQQVVEAAPCGPTSRCEFLTKGKHTCPEAGGKQFTTAATARLKQLILEWFVAEGANSKAPR